MPAIPGREVWVHPEVITIHALRNTYAQGEAVPVVEIVTPDSVDPARAGPPGSTVPAQRKPMCSRSRNACSYEFKAGKRRSLSRPCLAWLDSSRPPEISFASFPNWEFALDLISRGRKDLELAEVPDVTYDDIGGLDTEIQQIREAIEEPYTYPTIFRRYDLERPRGILLYGPPGCGKTMIAKAIANSLSQQIERSLKDLQAAIDVYLKTDSEDGMNWDDPLLREWMQITRDPGTTMGFQPSGVAGRGCRQNWRASSIAAVIEPAKAAEEIKKSSRRAQRGSRATSQASRDRSC